MCSLGIRCGVPPAALVGPEELARQAGLPDVLRLGSNESPWGPSPKARRAIEDELGRVHTYGDPIGRELREVLAARHHVRPDEICVAAGIDDLLGLAVRAFLAPGAAAILSHGTFPTFEMHAISYGGKLKYVPYRGTQVDLEGLARQGPGVVYLANPDNPTGSVHPPQKIAALLDALPAGSLLLHDEAYANFLPVSERLADLPPDPRIIRMRTFSKEYGLAGLRLGYAIATTDTVAALNEVRLLYGNSRLALAAGLASLQDDAWIESVVAHVEAGREEYYRLGEELGLPTVASSTNFVLFDCETRERAVGIMQGLLQRGIHIRKPPVPPVDHFVRISVGLPDARLQLRALLLQVAQDLPAAPAK
ncbi:MAG: aminotransferase class I/II-fold pyridoxal phosphate-dependent enzyme [Candidatus Xenobia bacterium]